MTGQQVFSLRFVHPHKIVLGHRVPNVRQTFQCCWGVSAVEAESLTSLSVSTRTTTLTAPEWRLQSVSIVSWCIIRLMTRGILVSTVRANKLAQQRVRNELWSCQDLCQDIDKYFWWGNLTYWYEK